MVATIVAVMDSRPGNGVGTGAVAEDESHVDVKAGSLQEVVAVDVQSVATAHFFSVGLQPRRRAALERGNSVAPENVGVVGGIAAAGFEGPGGKADFLFYDSDGSPAEW